MRPRVSPCSSALARRNRRTGGTASSSTSASSTSPAPAVTTAGRNSPIVSLPTLVTALLSGLTDTACLRGGQRFARPAADGVHQLRWLQQPRPATEPQHQADQP